MDEPSTNGHGLELEPLGAQGKGTTGPRMLVPLFIVPLVIVAVIVAIFLALGSVLGNEKSVEEWITQVETGGVNERWQAAAQLSEIATKQPEKLASASVRERFRRLFTVAGPSDTRIRQFVGKLWGAIGDADAAPLMIDGIHRMQEVLAQPNASEGAQADQAREELIIYLRSLGELGISAAEPEILSSASDGESGVRKAVAEALGMLGRKTVKSGAVPSAALTSALLQLHSDGDAWVRMNAALSLAKVGRVEGIATLETMLDRGWLKSQHLQFPDDGQYVVTQHDPAFVPIASALAAIDALMEGAAKGGPPVDAPSLRSAIQTAAHDQNSEIKKRALDLLKKLGE